MKYFAIFAVLMIHLGALSQNKCDSLQDLVIKDKVREVKVAINQFEMDINCLSESGSSVLGVAASRGNLKMVKYLLKKGANPNLRQIGIYKSGQTPIFDATFIYEQSLEPNLSLKSTPKKLNYKEKDSIVELLIKKGADIHLVDQNQTSLLMIAAMSNRDYLVKLYIKLGVNINIQNKYGNTALIYAVLSNNIQIVRTLIEAEADRNIRNNNGESALDIAKNFNSTDIVKLLSR